jgi:hypothetical protein
MSATIDATGPAGTVHGAMAFPAAQRSAAARGVSTLEGAIGSHTMPMDVWIDSH